MSDQLVDPPNWAKLSTFLRSTPVQKNILWVFYELFRNQLLLKMKKKIGLIAQYTIWQVNTGSTVEAACR